MGAREEIARLWAAMHGSREHCVVVHVGKRRVDLARETGSVIVAAPLTEAEVSAYTLDDALRAYGADESSALAALLGLVRLRARMRRDEIDAALAAGGA